VAALRAEAELTPKPGLVDQRGSGAHTDMDMGMLLASADALRDGLVACARAAQNLPLEWNCVRELELSAAPPNVICWP
jgi:triphosphoribosyl-dephospho-CoA synthase